MYNRIAVYLSSKSNLPESYVRAAREVGKFLGTTHRTLIYGGSSRGLMEELAQEAKKHGAQVWGIVPQIIFDRGWVSDTLDVTIPCVDLVDRKAIMSRESQAAVVLPGGIGTLDEAFSVMANAVIGISRQPVVFYNVDNCWTPLLAAIRALFAQKLVSGNESDYFLVAENLEELKRILQEE